MELEDAGDWYWGIVAIRFLGSLTSLIKTVPLVGRWNDAKEPNPNPIPNPTPTLTSLRKAVPLVGRPLLSPNLTL